MHHHGVKQCTTNHISTSGKYISYTRLVLSLSSENIDHQRNIRITCPKAAYLFFFQGIKFCGISLQGYMTVIN